MRYKINFILGEAEYTFDIPTIGDLYAALVITKCGPAELVSLDPSEALVSLKLLF